jgi:CRISPR system Cascade subunit CasD
MATLLLQCIAPLQAWGTQSNFSVRDTGREPSKSGVIGLLCAALGRPRAAPVDDLAQLLMGVRVDQEGQILRDFHTAGQGAADPYKGFLQADGKTISKGTIISNRYYLADAAFLVGLEGDRRLLQTLHAALNNPQWALLLGRKACPPARPAYLTDGLREEGLRDALESYPWLGAKQKAHQRLAEQNQRLRLILEAADGPDMRRDHPLSFARDNRQFALRRLITDFTERMPDYRHPFAKQEPAP